MNTMTIMTETQHGVGDIQRQRGPRDSAEERLQPARLPLWREAFFGFDWLTLVGSAVYAGRGVPRGDGSPVVVAPGLFASDWSLVELRGWLARLGYRPYFSEIGLNATCPTKLVARLSDTVERAHLETGLRVRIIGHSLGGLLARGAALHRSDHVRQVITLGSPVSGLRAHPAVMAAAELLHGSCSPECVTALQRPLPSAVAEACLYSKRDGVVDWRTCVRQDGATNVEVESTHVGMVCNPAVYRALAGLLAACPASVREQPLGDDRFPHEDAGHSAISSVARARIAA
jgi:triacylglycerol lipase